MRSHSARIIVALFLFIASPSFASKRYLFEISAEMDSSGGHPDPIKAEVRFGAERGFIGDACTLPGSNGAPRERQFGLLLTNLSKVKKTLKFESIHGRTDFMGPSGGTSYQKIPVEVTLAPGAQKELSWTDCVVGNLQSLTVEVFIEPG
jgi:hypothetical protein